MADPATLAMLAKAAAAVLSSEKARKTIGWVIVAIFSPIIVLLVLLCSLLSGTAEHNTTALELCFHGGVISASVPEDYRGHIENMRDSFFVLDGGAAELDGQMENGDSLDRTRVKAIFYEASPRKKEPEPKEFALPPAGESMRRVYAYLLKQRFISREVLNTFVSQRLIYESCEKSKDNTKEYHNAVFVGFDEHGVPRHAHKRGVYTHGKSYRGNVSGCDPRYSFHWTGSSDRLYVFEAPIDLLSFLTLYPQDWQKHSYVALCGTSEHAMLWMLEQNPQIRKVALCLDHDEAGIEASGQHEDTLRERGIAAAPLRSQYKDWNADLKALHGLPAEPAEEHPQLLAADPICQRIGAAVSSGVAKPEQAEQKLPILLQDYKNHLHQGRFDRAMDAMELAAAMALSSALREFRQMGKVVSPQQGAERLRQSIQPHHNRGSLKNRADEIAMELQRILAQKASAGICGRESKESLAYRWLELAASCAKVPIRYEADQIKQRQKEEQAQRGAGPVME